MHPRQLIPRSDSFVSSRILTHINLLRDTHYLLFLFVIGRCWCRTKPLAAKDGVLTMTLISLLRISSYSVLLLAQKFLEKKKADRQKFSLCRHPAQQHFCHLPLLMYCLDPRTLRLAANKHLYHSIVSWTFWSGESIKM